MLPIKIPPFRATRQVRFFRSLKSVANRMHRSTVFFYLRLIFGITLLLLLLTFVDLGEMRRALASVKPHLIAAGLVGILIDSVLMTYRWGSILWVQRPEIAFTKLLRFYFISGFLGNFAPLSNDVIKMYCSAKHTSDLKGAFSSVFLDRIIGMLSLGIIALIALVALQGVAIAQVGTMAYSCIIVLLILSIGLPLILQTGFMIRNIRRVLGRSRWGPLMKVAEIYENLLLYQNQRGVMAKVLLVSFANHLISIWVFYIIAQSFPTSVAIGYFFLFIPVAWVLAMVPVTVGGIGVLEGAIVYLFSNVGMPVETCVGMVVWQRVMRIAATLPGGVIYTLKGLTAKGLPT